MSYPMVMACLMACLMAMVCPMIMACPMVSAHWCLQEMHELVIEGAGKSSGHWNRLVQLKNCGHIIPLEQPEEVQMAPG